MQAVASTTVIRIACVLGLMLTVVSVRAGDWLIDPRVNINESFTDNVTLAPTDELADLVTTVLPGITVRGTSARLDLNLDYNLQYLKYADNTQFDDLNHQMQAAAELMVFEDLVYFSTRSSLSQQNTSSNRQFAQSNRSQTGNRTNVLYYEYGPVVRHALGRWASLDASYLMNRSDRTVIAAPDALTGQVVTAPGGSKEDVIRVNVDSGPRLPRTPISLSYTSREQTRAQGVGQGQRSKLQRVLAEVGYQLNRQLRLTAEGGAEFNQVQTARNNRDGPSWFFGGVWTPTPRTEIAGRYGSRFFGKTFTVNASHRMRRVVMGFNYGEELRTTNQVQSELELVPLTDPFGNPILDPNTTPDILTPPGLPSLADDVILSRDISASLSYAGRRDTVDLRVFDNRNEFQGTGVLESYRGVSVNFTHSLTRLVSASVGGLWRKADSLNRSQETWRISPAMHYILGPNMTLNLNYEFVNGSGATALDNFTENAVTADVSYVF
ncbi:MAG: TIGR03016 family PEP-CTERM system-associated outer membrane protein [Gammaproteobacteria bacterium]